MDQAAKDANLAEIALLLAELSAVTLMHDAIVELILCGKVDDSSYREAADLKGRAESIVSKMGALWREIETPTTGSLH